MVSFIVSADADDHVRKRQLRMFRSGDGVLTSAADGLGAEVSVWGRLVLDPEQRVPDGELRDNLFEIVGPTEAVPLDGPECGLVEVNGSPTVPHRKLGLCVWRRHGALGSSTHCRVDPAQPSPETKRRLQELSTSHPSRHEGSCGLARNQRHRT
jgi:hypothetical protein